MQVLVPFEEKLVGTFFTIFGLLFIVVYNNHFELSIPYRVGLETIPLFQDKVLVVQQE